MSADQWKSYGDCSKCRRNSYCCRTCTAHKGFIRRAIYTKFHDVMAKSITSIEEDTNE